MLARDTQTVSFRRFAAALLVAGIAAAVCPGAVFAAETANGSGKGDEAWEKFQQAVRAPTAVNPADDQTTASSTGSKVDSAPATNDSADSLAPLPGDGITAETTTVGEGVFQLKFMFEGRNLVRTVHLPVQLGALIQPDFRPNRSLVKMTNGKPSMITLVEMPRGKQDHQSRKIMINLSSDDARFPGDCIAALYPSGGSFYSLPVVLGQRCSDIVTNPDPSSVASAD